MAGRSRIGDLVLNPLADNRLWPIVLGLAVGQCYEVRKHIIPGGGSPSPIDVICYLEGWDHAIKAPNSWKTTLHLSAAPRAPSARGHTVAQQSIPNASWTAINLALMLWDDDFTWDISQPSRLYPITPGSWFFWKS